MTEKEQKAIELLKEEISRPVEVPEDKFNTFILYNIENTKIILNLISKLQSDIEIKDKVIDLMAEKLVEDSDVFNYQHSMTEEKWKEYFYKQVEKVGGEDE